MKTRFLTIAVAIASLFATQQAFAKTPSTHAAKSSKHHKKSHAKTKAQLNRAPAIIVM